MTAHIYIVTDGAKTKIGISTNLERRLPAYKTHNPNHEVYKTYPCAIDEARRIELFIKQAFKEKLTGQGKEWFEIPAEEINKYVCNLLATSTISDALPSLAGVKLTEEADMLLGKIYDAVNNRDKSLLSLKENFAELFGKTFSLGVPYHKLPEDLLAREYLRVDLNNCANNSELVTKAVTSTTSFPYSDHCWYYFHLLKLSSGKSIAICTAEVSMPYPNALERGVEKEIVSHANELGLYATFHHDWSWHSPGETALILYQPKTPLNQIVRQWDKSFRKWVMERRGFLKFETYEDPDSLANAIEDVCDDSTFPFEFKDYTDLQQKYLGPFRHFLDDSRLDNDWEDERTDAMRFLVQKWKEAKYLKTEPHKPRARGG